MDQPGSTFKPNILIAPLDWGLGHATRCIPIIRTLIQKKCNVLIAAEGKIKILLQKEFPQLVFIDFKGYRIHYSKNGWTLPLQIGKQIPKIFSTIQYENARLKEIVKEYSVHGIISDNRYGLYHQTIPSVFITHQLKIKTPFGSFVEGFIQKINYKYIKRFSECWIPDNESENNLAGELSHPAKKPAIPTKYIGALSRFERIENGIEKHLLIILSGPEPQRTILENLLIEQLDEYKENVVLVRGLPEETNQLQLSPNVSVHNHLSAGELNQKINDASIVISRCGYSTVMDLAKLKKKSILIPTPGQTEQEYLARHLMKINFALCIEQKKFRLKNAVELSSQFNYRIEQFSLEDSFEDAINSFLNALKPGS